MVSSSTDKKSKDTFYSVKQERIESENLLEEKKIEAKDSKCNSLKKSKKSSKVIVEFKNIINYTVNESEKIHVRNKMSQITVFYKLPKNMHHYRKSICIQSIGNVVLGL